jgi:hypothetical protein
VVKSLTAFVGGEGGRVGCVGTRKTEVVILSRKKANTACGSDLYINKEKLHGHFENPIHLTKRFLPAKFGIKYAYMNNLKGPVYFYERKVQAPPKSSDKELNERHISCLSLFIYVSKEMYQCNLKSAIYLFKILS